MSSVRLVTRKSLLSCMRKWWNSVQCCLFVFVFRGRCVSGSPQEEPDSVWAKASLSRWSPGRGKSPRWYVMWRPRTSLKCPLFFSAQWRRFHGDRRARQPPGRLHGGVHRGGAARREPHPLAIVPLTPGEPGAGVGRIQPGTRTPLHARTQTCWPVGCLNCVFVAPLPTFRWRSAMER